ncbi:mucin-2-like isoform X5 [Tenebrio molitor]|uniref:mucin-2-like isoform X5 n=1 Tax=Tenebrio molitor TaxID=7067 RepID=UPI0036248510
MKVFYLLVFFCLLSADAQRRSVKSELLSENESPPKSARRGRARFTVTTDTPEVEEHKRPDPPGRRLTSRRRPETHTEAPIRKTYEVEEVVDDTPIEPFRKSGKSRVLTENKFEAHNAPSSNALFQSATTESLDEALKSVDTGVVDTTSSSEPSSSTVSTNLESSASELTSGEISKIDNEISRSQPETTTPITSRTTRRSNGRSRSHGGAAPSPTVASRARSRSRATRKPEEQSIATPAPSRPVHRGSRRRADSTGAEARTRGPSVIGAAETVELPSRSRTGRKIPGGTRRSEEKAPEKITIDLPQPRRSNGRKSVEVTTGRSRLRSRSREVPPVIDEQKLEVLPLFERETKTVRPVRKLVSRRRNLNSAEEVETSATENDVKVAPKPPRQSVVVETRTESSVKRRKTNKLVTQGTKPTVKSTIKSTTKPAVKKSVKPVIKESVVSEVTEVTSKRTVTRKKLLPRTNFESPGFTSRGVKKSEVNLTAVKKNKSGLTSSEEEIDDSDNYPEQFKALLQAKKQKKESRPLHRVVTASPTITKTTEKVVNSLSSTTTQATTSEASRQLEDSENELDPKSARPTRRRFSHSTATRPTRKSKVVARSTTAAPPKDHRFHAKFNTEQEATTASSVRPTRGFSPKPPRGLYSSRKNKESYAKSKSGSSTTTAQIPIPKKHNRYSSRYRNDASSRGAIRTSTNAPAYLPTIPTITPPTTSVKSAFQDKDLGVEVISFDDPVNTVPSANLVSGEYLASSTENHLTSPLVSASQTKTTEKPVSIIERIINSITAISTTEVPHPTRLTTPTTETPTKESAILKLATKKSTKLDKTQTTQKIPVVTVTSEKPTTIIERILSSLSAIQVDNSTDSKNFKSKQVGTNFNTISSPSTTPITRVTKSTLPAQFSTSVNPLIVLDEISNEQTLQKRTIGKLLALLNTLTSTTASSHPTQLVVVTPKTTNYVVGTSAATTTTTVPTTTVPSTTTTTDQLFTSPNPGGASLGSRSKPPESTTVRYTSTPTITTLSTQAPTTPFAITSTPSPTLTSSEASSTSTTPGDFANELAPLPLSIESGVTSLAIDSTTPSTTDSSLSVSSTLPTTELAVDTETAFAFPSTIPALVNFEVDQNTIPPLVANPLSLSTVNNATTTTGTTPSSTVPTVQANPLSISSTSSSTNESSTSPTTISSSSTPVAAVTTTPGTTTSSTAPTATLPTLTEILNGRTVQAFNSIINISDLSKVQTLDVDPKTNRVLNADEIKDKTNIVFRWKPVTSPTYTFDVIKSNPVTTTLPTPTLSNRILDDPVALATSSLPTTQQPTTTTTTAAPTTTTAAPTTTTAPPTTTTAPPTTTTASTTTTLPPTTTATATTRRQRTTVLPLSQPATTTFRTTTGFPSTTFFPTFLTTLFSTIRPRRLSTTESPITIVTPISNRVQPTTTPRIGINTISGDLAAASTTRTVSTTPVPTTTLLSTLPVSTTIRSTRRRGTAPTTTALPVTTTVLTTTIPTSTASASARNARRSTAAPKVTSTSATKKLKKLTEQQKKDLETLAQLEMEQAAILKQLAFLTNLNFAGMKPTTEKNDLANRIIALAVERDKGREKVTTVASETLSSEGSRQAKKIAPSDEQSLEELVKQLNIATPSTLTTQYGKSNDAIVAALLKEQGIGPTTPKIVEDIYSQTTTTTRRPKPKPTTRAPGPLMQSLNWLLNVLAPPTTKRPRPKPKPKPKPKPEPTSEELLTHQPTHITPVVTPAPRQNIVSSLSQEDIQKLIKQLEQIQKDPKNSQNLDFSSINSLQSLIGSNGVQVSSAGTTGTTTRETTPLSTTKTRVAKSTTAIPLSVSNSIVDDDFVSTTTTKPRVSLPPVKLRPVPGIEDSDTLVRGQLINAAVNVTRAISSFLGTALQDAAHQFTRVFSSGSANLNDYFGSRFVLTNITNISGATSNV